jgi:putative transposase
MATFQRLRLVSADAPRRAYPSDLTDSQWAVVAPLLRASTRTGPGRPPQVPLRDVVDALLYIKQTGCPWRYLPHDFPPRSTVHYYFDQWTQDGTLRAVMDQLRERQRSEQGRAPRPTAAIIDSQTVKTAAARTEVGWDGGK